VLNSVVSLEAESDVLNCLNAFARQGGKVYFSGRCIESPIAELDESSVQRKSKCNTYQLDENGFSASFRAGQWYYQKFHGKREIQSKAASHGFKIVSLFYNKKTWIAETMKIRELPAEAIEASITREFNMRYSQTKRYDNARYILEALGNLKKATENGLENGLKNGMETE
jgi:ParB family chromosome partitioning protein